MKGHRLQALVYSLIIFLLLPVTSKLSPVFAADDIGVSQITPASPLYFLKSVREILELKFAGTTNIKALRRLEFATRRIREVKSLAGTSHEDLIAPTLARYLAELNELNGVANVKDEVMAANISRTITQQMSALLGVYDQISNPGGKRSIRAAINELSRWQQQLINRFDQAKQIVFVQQVASSKILGCKFLSKEASSSALNEVERVVFTDRANECLKDLNCDKNQATGQQPCPQNKVL